MKHKYILIAITIITLAVGYISITEMHKGHENIKLGLLKRAELMP